MLLVALYFIYFLDLAGISIAYIIFVPILISSEFHFLPPDLSLGWRNLILGLLYASYPLTQFFGAPILGAFSDRFGRKKPLLFSSFLTAFAFFLSALSILFTNLILLFFSRMLAGIAAGNMTIAQATVADFISLEKRPRYMAIFNIVGGLSWVIAPYFGSMLANPKIASWFNPSTPFWIMGLLFFFSAILTFFAYPSHFKRVKEDKEEGFIESLLNCFRIPVVSSLLAISLLSTFGWMTYQGFISPYLAEKYAFSGEWIGKTFAYFSSWWLIGGLLSTEWLLKKFSAAKIALLQLFLVAAAVVSYQFFQKSIIIWFASALANLAEAIVISCFFALFSQLAKNEIQGKIFGFWNAGFALSSAFTPILSGLLSFYSLNIPFLIAFLILLSSGVLYLYWFKKVLTI